MFNEQNSDPNPSAPIFQPDTPPSDLNPVWERREQLGLIPALIETWKLSLTQPRQFFSHFNAAGSPTDPIIYIVIMSFVSGLSLFIPGIDSLIPTPAEGVGAAALSASSKILIFLFSPVMAIIGLLIMSGIYHLGLILMGGVSNPFFATFKVTAYSSGTSVFSIIPVVGFMIGAIWNVVLLAIGLSEVHKTEMWKSLVAVLVPVVLCSCCAIFMFAGVFFAAMSSMQN